MLHALERRPLQEIRRQQRGEILRHAGIGLRVGFEFEAQVKNFLQPVAELRYQPSQVGLGSRNRGGKCRRRQAWRVELLRGRIFVAALRPRGSSAPHAPGAAHPAPDGFQRVGLQLVDGDERHGQRPDHPQHLQVLLQPAQIVAQLRFEKSFQSTARGGCRQFRRRKQAHGYARRQGLQPRISQHRHAVFLCYGDRGRQVAVFPFRRRLAFPFRPRGAPRGVFRARRLQADLALAALQELFDFVQIATRAEHGAAVVDDLHPHTQVVGQCFRRPERRVDLHAQPRLQ